ncbi:MAG: hypothetical protein ING06_05000 [Roseomonas sp.]|nr:hypothetical protein [Roseomonas sp.]
MLLLWFADAGAKTERVRPYEIAGPAGLGSDEPLCRRLAAALNAEGSRELTVPRKDSMFARWQEVQHRDSREIIHEATRADILNEGKERTVYRVTYLYAPLEPFQALVFMRNDAEALPIHERIGPPSTWAEAITSGRMVDSENLIQASLGFQSGDFLERYPPFATTAGRRFLLGRMDAKDLIVFDTQRVLVLLENTHQWTAMLVEVRAQRVAPICYLS